MMCCDFDLSKSANPGLSRILFETTCLFSAVIISIMASFSSSVKTYLNFGKVRFASDKGHLEPKFVTYSGCLGVLDDGSRVHALREDLVEAVDEGAVVDEAWLLRLVPVDHYRRKFSGIMTKGGGKSLKDKIPNGQNPYRQNL